jgi:hypothetical protein
MDLEVKCVARKASRIFFGVDNSVQVYDISEHSHPALKPLYKIKTAMDVLGLNALSSSQIMACESFGTL